MAELFVFLLFVVALGVIEFYDVMHHRPTISEDVQGLSRTWRPLAALVGFAFGWFTCHFFST
jgi:hypothetical protein